jgi:ketosteroid isomerase-like protein
MKLTLILTTLVITMTFLGVGQIKKNKMEEEILNLEKEFAQAIINNDAEAIGFLGVIKSGALTHEMMESDDVSVRIYGDTAVVMGLTTSKGKFMGQDFTTRERATDIFVNQQGRWQCVFSQLTRVTKK